MAQSINQLIHTAIFSPDEKTRKNARTTIHKIAKEKGIYSASIHNLYMAFGQGKIKGFTVPAINIRTLTYDSARLLFRLAKKKKVGAFIFEIARSEIKYTAQEPDEYTVSVLAAAIKEEYKGPIFLQGDHYQFSAKKFNENRDEEIKKIKDLVKKSIDAEFYNIDIDASTLVDLEKLTLSEQQKNNYEMTALITKYIRSIEPKKITISVGGEIGHIGGKNSTPEEFKAFMNGYLPLIKKSKLTGISKVSVQTGTSHGGIPLPDGTIAKVSIDFNVLKDISTVARSKYKIGGSVQHGASTLPNDLFNHFPKINALEIHLATGFQNIVYDNLPTGLKKETYQWVKDNCRDEWKEGQTEKQFVYKTRKKALGPFKEKLWNMNVKEKKPILKKLEVQFLLLLKKLNVFNTKKFVDKYIK
ncbi:aldolase [Candidatus Roizmanbacteria bacterium CG11_big_fil_rev_8_21_14_0_20_35_14]|uniref:Aldolase n=3 Tax=Candidatus Roizmaniibacteriota TaxID=1752723 RepID=A0A2M8EXM0_9BACT|nr:MAG: aldolase [Candidatus Roizmanbacteria bacterium CG11_big_fil_rev_8_21_14_0_20_35_14]PJC30792.1 MAG: aldolase [Candidatus Roizmanbacteria bacterium CG_4_9_14_0_2_um_filter_36_12]PJC80528.1 MAG: aldolase [Candidatus Roizmanbacteria bacterium CG_4_8_14_3_um_filter_36_12]